MDVPLIGKGDLDPEWLLLQVSPQGPVPQTEPVNVFGNQNSVLRVPPSIERFKMKPHDDVLPGAYEAPIILWDSIQAMGIADGLAHMTLCASLSIPDGTGGVKDQSAIVAHLRMSIRALSVMKEAIAKIELMAKLTPRA